MSMEDILKVLVNSRQQGGSTQGSDPMTDLIGGLLSGVSGQTQSHAPVAPAGYQQQQSSGGLGDMMGLLEMFMGNNQSGATQSSTASSNPIMMLLQPYVEKLAKKANIPPEIAMIVVSFGHKLF